jgi:hypothetical protein
MPNLDAKSELVLIRQSGRLHVGDSVESALVLYPPLQKSKELSELPATVPGLSASGWQGENEGFGMAAKDGRVALALRSQDLLEAGDLSTIVRNYESEIGRQADDLPQSSRGQYWFWTSQRAPTGAQRLMIYSRTGKSGKRSVVIALGDSTVMDALRMNPQAARNDLDKAEAVLRITN